MAPQLTERGQRMLAMVPPFYVSSDLLSQTLITAPATELDRIEAEIDRIIDNYFVLRSDDLGLAMKEALLGLTIRPADLDLEQRRKLVLAYWQRLRKSPAGAAWIERVDRILPSWKHAVHHPDNVRGVANYYFRPAVENDLPVWTYRWGQDDFQIDEDGLFFAGMAARGEAQQLPPLKDRRVIERFVGGNGGTNHGIVIKGNDNGAIMAILESTLTDGRSNRLYLYKTNSSGTLTELTHWTLASPLDISGRYWLYGRIIDSDVVVQIWNEDPAMLAGAPIDNHTYSLTGADITKWGTGVQGYAGLATISPTSGNTRIEQLRIDETGWVVPNNTVRVMIPLGTDRYAIKKLLRDITPAAVAIEVVYDSHFLLGISHLGEDVL